MSTSPRETKAAERGRFPCSAEASTNLLPLRNATVTTCPTGTWSIIAGVSSGWSRVRLRICAQRMDNTHLVETNEILREKLQEEGLYTTNS